MASIKTVMNSAGEVTGYRFRACVGRDEQYKQALFVKVVVSKSSKFFVLITSRGSVRRFE